MPEKSGPPEEVRQGELMSLEDAGAAPPAPPLDTKAMSAEIGRGARAADRARRERQQAADEDAELAAQRGDAVPVAEERETAQGDLGGQWSQSALNYQRATAAKNAAPGVKQEALEIRDRVRAQGGPLSQAPAGEPDPLGQQPPRERRVLANMQLAPQTPAAPPPSIPGMRDFPVEQVEQTVRAATTIGPQARRDIEATRDRLRNRPATSPRQLEGGEDPAKHTAAKRAEALRQADASRRSAPYALGVDPGAPRELRAVDTDQGAIDEQKRAGQYSQEDEPGSHV